MEPSTPGLVLLVDDEPSHVEPLARALRPAGYDVRQLTSGAAALDVLRRDVVEVVLLDVMMPGMSGLETLQVIRQHWSAAQLPVIMLTSSERHDDVAEALRLGANDYLVKPLDRTVALARIRPQVDACRAERVRRESDHRRVQGERPGLWEWTIESDAVAFSGAWAARLGWGDRLAQPTMADWLDRIEPADAARVRAQLQAHLDGSTPRFAAEFRMAGPDAAQVWVRVDGVAARDVDLRARRVAGSIADRTESRLSDALTGLPNRTACVDRVQQRLARPARGGAGCAVFVIDLDRFGRVNDACGHAVADQVLVELGRRLGRAVRSTDLVTRDTPEAHPWLARLDGDQFTVLVDQLSRPADARVIAERLLAIVREPVMVSGMAVKLTASLGVAHGTSAHVRADDLLAEADAALAGAKAGGGDACLEFSRDLRERVEAQYLLDADLRWALERHELDLRFTPLVQTASGLVAAYVAEPWWASPSHGLVTPSRLQRAAARCGAAVALERWTLEEACRCAATWRAGPAGAAVHVPVSSASCDSGDFEAHVRRSLAHSGLEPGRLVLDLHPDLAEAADDLLVRALEDLRSHGVCLALGQPGADGGAGTLARLPFEAVYTSMPALAESVSEGEDRPPLVAVAQSLRVPVLVTGVDTAADAARVRVWGGAAMAGAVVGDPLTRDAVEAAEADARIAGSSERLSA